MAIQKFGGNPRTGYRYSAHFSFNAETEMEKERYEEATITMQSSWIHLHMDVVLKEKSGK